MGRSERDDFAGIRMDLAILLCLAGMNLAGTLVLLWKAFS